MHADLRTPLLLSALTVAAIATTTVPNAHAAALSQAGTQDTIRIHSSTRGVTFAAGVGTLGGTVGTDPVESESSAESSYGYAYARANLATASLHAAANSTDTAQTLDAGPLARATLRETLTFDVAGADRLTVTTIGVSWTQSGAVLGDVNAKWRSVLDLFSAGAGGLFERRVGFDATPGASLFDDDKWTLVFPDVSVTPMGELPWSYAFDRQGNLTARGSVQMVGMQPEMLLTAGLEVNCWLGTDCDFRNSAFVRFELPSNVTMRSESGLFMSQVSSVPEARTTLMFAIGGVGLVCAARARRRREPNDQVQPASC